GGRHRGPEAHAPGGEAAPDVVLVGPSEAGAIRGQDRVTGVEEGRVDGVELHAVGHDLQGARVAGGPAHAVDDAGPDLEQGHGPDLAEVVHLVGGGGADGTAREGAVGQVDLGGVDVREGHRVVGPAVRAHG